MKIRNKILLYFSTTSILLIGVAFITIYILFSAYREEDFQQRQKEKIITTLNFISEIEESEHDLTRALDKITINSFLNEKLLIFDQSKQLIYTSLDDVTIGYSKDLLNELSDAHQWIEKKDGKYDVVAIHFTSNDKSYYGISKAFDKFGHTKLVFLEQVLITLFVIFSIIIVFISLYIATKITRPISQFANQLSQFKIGDSIIKDEIETSNLEIELLNNKYKELIQRINKSYTFQKNAINHISHQLKTPIAILLTEQEKLLQHKHASPIEQELKLQIEKTKSLGEIINILLEISKIESGQNFRKTNFRIDELIFDIIEETNTLYPKFKFEIQYSPELPNPDNFIVNCNKMLIRQAFVNLINNCIAYSNNNKGIIVFNCNDNYALTISISNEGEIINNIEVEQLFNHFFRGENSRNKLGFGLGLTLCKSILEMHQCEIKYTSNNHNVNTFLVKIPFSLS